MNKKLGLSLLYGWLAVAALSGLAQAQSTLEYTTLMTTVAGAARSKKEKSQGGQNQGDAQEIPGALTQLYGEGNRVMASKSASLLGQIGAGVRAEEDAPAAITKEPARQTQPEEDGEQEASSTAAKVYLKTGKVIEGILLGQDRHSIKVDCAGIPVTYFNEEIDKIVE